MTRERDLKLHIGRMHTPLEQPSTCPSCNTMFIDGWTKSTHKCPIECMCNICGKQFASNKKMTDHKRTMNDEKAFKCDTCNRSYSYAVKSSYIRHEKLHHGVTHINHKLTKIHKCKKCKNKVFTAESFLNRHMRNAHNKDNV